MGLSRFAGRSCYFRLPAGNEDRDVSGRTDFPGNGLWPVLQPPGAAMFPLGGMGLCARALGMSLCGSV